MNVCKVYGCRFPTTHITSKHSCGKCAKMGHGQTECGHPEKIALLKICDSEIPFGIQCCALNCSDFKTHTTDGHFCKSCKRFGHDSIECPDSKWITMVERGTTFNISKEMYLEKQNLKLQARKQMGLNEHKVYTIVYGGMGCTWYVRRANVHSKMELFFMHSDNWGQYGPTTDDRPKLDKFIEGYRQVGV